ncbi:hypothetical protein DFH09DRAFT_1316008 [Mycena vulgaris]|nr:hypothetical protein DFH09DRAFT_1316008 [Mycena vulgaris]
MAKLKLDIIKRGLTSFQGTLKSKKDAREKRRFPTKKSTGSIIMQTMWTLETLNPGTKHLVEAILDLLTPAGSPLHSCARPRCACYSNSSPDSPVFSTLILSSMISPTFEFGVTTKPRR